GVIGGRTDWELAETFFTPVPRRVFTTVGVDSNIEFVDSDFAAPSVGGAGLTCRTYLGGSDAAAVVEDILHDARLDAAFEDLHRDSPRVSAPLTHNLPSLPPSPPLDPAAII